MRKYLEKYGLSSIGASAMDFFIPSKHCLASGVHLISMFFSQHVGYIFHYFSEGGYESYHKIYLSQKILNLDLIRGSSILLIASTLLGYILMPSWEIIWPNNFPYFIENHDFFIFREMPNFLHFLNILSRCATCSSSNLEKTVISSKRMTRILSFHQLNLCTQPVGVFLPHS